MPGFEAFVFDMDGVLTDTEVLWDRTRRQLAADAGRPWPEQATAAMMGMSTPEWAGYLAATVGLPGTAEQIAAQVIEAMAARYREHLPLLPGAVAAVHRLAGLLPLGLASSSPRLLIDTTLDLMGVTEMFAATVSTEEVARGKPAPDGYLQVCRHLEVAPTRTVCIEDSTNGIRSAAAAGLTVIAAPQPFHPPAPQALALASAVVTGLDEVDAPLLARLADPGGERPL